MFPAESVPLAYGVGLNNQIRACHCWLIRVLAQTINLERIKSLRCWPEQSNWSVPTSQRCWPSGPPRARPRLLRLGRDTNHFLVCGVKNWEPADLLFNLLLKPYLTKKQEQTKQTVSSVDRPSVTLFAHKNKINQSTTYKNKNKRKKTHHFIFFPVYQHH